MKRKDIKKTIIWCEKNSLTVVEDVVVDVVVVVVTGVVVFAGVGVGVGAGAGVVVLVVSCFGQKYYHKNVHSREFESINKFSNAIRILKFYRCSCNSCIGISCCFRCGRLK